MQPEANLAYFESCVLLERLEDSFMTIERFSFAFTANVKRQTANGKRQAAACRKSKKIILF